MKAYVGWRPGRAWYTPCMHLLPMIQLKVERPFGVITGQSAAAKMCCRGLRKDTLYFTPC